MATGEVIIMWKEMGEKDDTNNIITAFLFQICLGWITLEKFTEIRINTDDYTYVHKHLCVKRFTKIMHS